MWAQQERPPYRMPGVISLTHIIFLMGQSPPNSPVNLPDSRYSKALQ